MRSTISPKIENVATTGMGSLAQVVVGSVKANVARTLAEVSNVRRENMCFLSGFKMTARQGLDNKPPNRAKNDRESIDDACDKNDRRAGWQAVMERQK